MKCFCHCIGVAFFLFTAGCHPTDEDVFSGPEVISGQVKDESGNTIPNAKISLVTAPTFETVFTTDLGLFYLKGFPAGRHKIKVEKIGFADYAAEVPAPINGVSTVNPRLVRRIYDVPAQKPVSKGPIRIVGGSLETDFDGDGSYEEFVAKGVAFSPAPIGGKPWTQAVYDKSILWLSDVHANTVRTYSGVDKYFLHQAAMKNIRVIVGYWVNLDLDLSVHDVRQKIIDDFATMVYDLKDFPGILMWNLGNEQNYSSTPNNGSSPYWYSLCQELAVTAYKIEGDKYHPVCINNGNLHYIGEAHINANDEALTYVDLWASNAYEKDFTSFFSSYRMRSTKPIVITEFGIDALNNITKTEYESSQALYDSANWHQIRSAHDVCVGATVFEFTDEWWKAGDPNTHDYGGYATGAHPDGFSNEEWWGIIAVTRDADNDGLDEWRPRKAYTMFKRNWE